MINKFKHIINTVFVSSMDLTFLDQLSERIDDNETYKNINLAFLIALSDHDLNKKAKTFLKNYQGKEPFRELCQFYLDGLNQIISEIETCLEENEDFVNNINTLYAKIDKVSSPDHLEKLQEDIWSVFFPEGTGIIGNEPGEIRKLRTKRTVDITALNKNNINNPADQVLFTSNILLTVPLENNIDQLSLDKNIKRNVISCRNESQKYWYDHPIPIGIESQKNEIIYGLKGLDQACKYENDKRKENNILNCVLSVSVTHEGLHDIAREYIRAELSKSEKIKNLNIFVFTEKDTRKIIKDVLVPAAEKYIDQHTDHELLKIFGVDGEYSRHYSFLKAIAAFWNILIDPDIKATFKIDLDQVFPQEILADTTGQSMFDHLKTPLWGALGKDSSGNEVELGLIAGALVNEKDISKSLFTPDVPFPDKTGFKYDERVFYSQLPQALSTEAEMMTRYKDKDLDGRNKCIQRVHVTGGTNGILVDSLIKYKPFVPSFIGRAEDQAYLLSVINNPVKEKLAYVHKDGLIMRHDKASFAKEAMNVAKTGKIIGDYIRILYFSEYARVLNKDIYKIKEKFDPFTGCFISPIPITHVYLRMCLKSISLFNDNNSKDGAELIRTGVKRLSRALNYKSNIKTIFETESKGWKLFYYILIQLKNAIKENDPFALNLRNNAVRLIKNCQIKL